MVAGSVLPPRMELANEDLLRAHVHAIFLFEAEISLGSSMVNVLDVSDENPTLAVNESIASALRDRSILKRAYASAKHVLESLEPDLQATDWYTDRWLEDVLNQAYISLTVRANAGEIFIDQLRLKPRGLPSRNRYVVH